MDRLVYIQNQLPHVLACDMVIMVDISGIILSDVQITKKLYKSNRIKEKKFVIYYCFTFQNAVIAVKYAVVLKGHTTNFTHHQT